jgi:hypothetical protein
MSQYLQTNVFLTLSEELFNSIMVHTEISKASYAGQRVNQHRLGYYGCVVQTILMTTMFLRKVVDIPRIIQSTL